MESWNKHRPGLDAIVYCDNLAVHRQPTHLQWAKDHHVNFNFLPPHTSHFLQPLDDLLFAVYKSQLNLLARRLNSALSMKADDEDELSNAMLSAAHHIAISKAFSKKRIIKSFDNTGIFPFNKEKILARAHQNIGAPDKVSQLVLI